MNGVEFAYWLQGYFEMMEENYEPLTVKQVDMIREHLTLAKENDPTNVFLSLMEGLLAGFSMITDYCDNQDEDSIRTMRLWLTSRIESSVKAQFAKVTSEFSTIDALNPLINLHQTCGSSTVFC